MSDILQRRCLNVLQLGFSVEDGSDWSSGYAYPRIEVDYYLEACTHHTCHILVIVSMFTSHAVVGS